MKKKIFYLVKKCSHASLCSCISRRTAATAGKVTIMSKLTVESVPVAQVKKLTHS